MSKDLKAPDPSEFGLTSFADLLRRRPPIPGEGDLSFEKFHQQLMASLAPMTPYEAVIAENLIAIEWELLQHRRMREAGLRREIADSICQAVIFRSKMVWSEKLEAACDAWVEAGNDEESYEFEPFDEDAAEQLGHELAEQLVDSDPEIQAEAEQELIELGMDSLEVMGEAYRSHNRQVTFHDQKIQELERRRRQVKSDLDDLQNARHAQGKIIDG